MANTTQYAQALQQMANTITSQKPVVTDPLRQPTTFQQMMAANDPYIANGLGFAEMLTNPFIANKQRANMELQQSMQNKLKADELKAKAAADLDENERYLREEARKDKQAKLDMLKYQEPVPGENFDTVAHEMLRAYNKDADNIMKKLEKSTVIDRSNPWAAAEFEKQRKADLAQLARYMEDFKMKGLKNFKTKELEKTPVTGKNMYERQAPTAMRREQDRIERMLNGEELGFFDEVAMLFDQPGAISDKKLAYQKKQMRKNAKAISDWRKNGEGKSFSQLKPVDVGGEINYLISQGANNAAGALQDTARSIERAGGLLVEGTHNLDGSKEYFLVANGQVQLIDPFNAVIKADDRRYNIGQLNQAQSRIDE